MDRQTRSTGGRGTASSTRRTGTTPTRRVATTRRRTVDESPVKFDFMFGKDAVMWIGIGVAVILVGYLLMATAIIDNPAENNGIWNKPLAVTIAPILLGIGYCLIVPLGILRRKKNEDEEPTDTIAGS